MWVTEDAQVVYDTLVKPRSEIVNYVTKYSGITADMMKDVTTTRADVQARLMALASRDDILIGHSLEKELKSPPALSSSSFHYSQALSRVE